MARYRLAPVLGISLCGLLTPTVAAAQADVIVVFEQHARVGEYAGDIDIAAQRLSPTGELGWLEGERAVDIAGGPELERNPYAIPDGSGGAIVVSESEARTGEHKGDSEIAAQRIDANGTLLWDSGERPTLVAFSDWAEKNPVAVPDGQGGAIVIFERHALSGEYAGDIDIGAQRLSASGRLLWEYGKGSADVSSTTYLERNVAAIPDGAGGAIIVFEAEARTGEQAGDTEIFAQRIDANGKALWGNGTAPVVVAATTWSETNPVVVSDGQGGAIVAFDQQSRGGEYAGDMDVAAQRISAAGTLLWNAGESPVDVASSTSLERHPAAIPDGLGGAIIVFEQETRSGDAGDPEVAAQRIDANGKLMWNDGDTSTLLAYSDWGEKRPVLVSDGQRGAIAIFETEARSGEYRGDVDIAAQRISPAGELQWEKGEESITVSSSPLTEHVIAAIPDGAGGAIIAFEVEPRTGEHAGDADVCAQRIDANGKMMWNNGERSALVGYTEWSEMHPIIVGR